MSIKHSNGMITKLLDERKLVADVQSFQIVPPGEQDLEGSEHLIEPVR